MLIAEIILTIAAWRKGWKGWALVPVGLAGVIAFLVGASIGASGGSVNDISPYFMLFDVGAIVALIVMLVVKREPAVDTPVTPRTADAPQPLANGFSSTVHQL